MAGNETPLIEVSNLDIDRANANVIKNANFKIYAGDYIGIVGPNGGGKTTLIMSILGIIPKKSGKIRLFGQDIKSFHNWEKIAYVSQTAINFDSQFPLTVKELVGLGRVNRDSMGRKLKPSDWDAVSESLSFMGISSIAKKRIGELSGGQKQRVFVAKAMVRNPELIFLDEPITGVDALTQEKFYKKLSDLNTKKGITVLIVSHDLTAVFCRMSKVMCVNREVNISKITEDFEPDKLMKETYGEHFHIVFHRHECEGVFNNG